MTTTTGTFGTVQTVTIPIDFYQQPMAKRDTVVTFPLPALHCINSAHGNRQTLRNISDGYVTLYAENGSIAGKLAHVLPPGREVYLVRFGKCWAIDKWGLGNK